MGRRGGRTMTTMPEVSSWNSGKTKMIRVPIKLAPQILRIARLLDKGIHPAEDICQEFLKVKERQYRRARLHFQQSSPRWGVFHEFRRWLKIRSEQ